jgi:sugar/nucleoside kinase (ribokinase family)
MADIVVRLPGPLAPRSDRPAAIELRGGGSAGNTASWLHHLGTRVTLVGRIGPVNDPFRGTALDGLSSAVAAGLVSDPAHPTGRCLVLVAPDGERTMVPDVGANAALVPADLAGHFAAGRHLHLSGYPLLGPASAAGRRALGLAREAGMTVSVAAASAAPLARVGAVAFLDWIGTDLMLFANVDEARVLTGAADPETAAAVLARRVRLAVVTCGRRGAVAADRAGAVRVPTEPLEPLDSTGAGDAFAAGCLDALGRGADTRGALVAGNSAAASACRKVGGRP